MTLKERLTDWPLEEEIQAQLDEWEASLRAAIAKSNPNKTLSEFRCPNCADNGGPKTGRLLGRNINVGAELYCSYCKHHVTKA